MNTQMLGKSVKSNYQKSKIGVIPNDWEVKKINDCSHNIFLGLTSKVDYVDKGGYPLIRATDIANGKLSFKNVKYISEKQHKELTKYRRAERGDVLVSKSGTLGTCTIVDTDREFSIYESIIVIKTKEEELNSSFLLQLLQDHTTFHRMLGTRVGGTVGHLNLKIFRDLVIPLPPIKEQQKIASILSTWDKAIEKKERLIKQKKNQKKGLMETLLKGEVRIPEFYEEWNEVVLKDIGCTYNGLSGKSAKDFGEGKPYIPYKTIFDDSRIDLNRVEYVSIEENDKQNKAMFGDIFFTTSSETPNEVGMSSVLLDDIGEIYLNSFCFGYRLNNFNDLIPEFARYLFRGDGFRRKTFSLAQGSTRFNISKNEVMKLTVTLPSVGEQRAIAKVLTNSDKGIKLLSEEVELLKDQKHGLMQVLLTGKVRV